MGTIVEKRPPPAPKGRVPLVVERISYDIDETFVGSDTSGGRRAYVGSGQQVQGQAIASGTYLKCSHCEQRAVAKIKAGGKVLSLCSRCVDELRALLAKVTRD